MGAIISASCLGQLLNYFFGTGIVNTSTCNKLPVLIGGIVSAVGLLIAIVFFRVKMRSM